jgi:MYXO-CTERM domain-containing protein
VTDNVPFHELASRYGLEGDGSSSPLHRWDDAAGAAYLSIDEPGADADVFVSYEDARAIREKIEAVRSEGLGGVIIWELGGGIRVDEAGAERNALLDAVGEALHGGEPRTEPEPDDPTPEDPSAPSPDEGEPPADPGSPVTDAGAPVDVPGDPGAAAAPAEEIASGDGGCSVSPASAAAPPTALLLGGLFALLLRRRTRRRARARRG